MSSNSIGLLALYPYIVQLIRTGGRVMVDITVSVCLMPVVLQDIYFKEEEDKAL